MDRRYTSTEIEAWEANELAVNNAVEALKAHLTDAPGEVIYDVTGRLDPEIHAPLAIWLRTQKQNANARRIPKAWSPDHNLHVWMLYKAADLICPALPPDPVSKADIRRSVAKTTVSTTLVLGAAIGGSVAMGLI